MKAGMQHLMHDFYDNIIVILFITRATAFTFLENNGKIKE